MNNKKTIISIMVIALIIIGFFIYKNFTRSYCWPYCEGMTDQDREEIKQSALDETKNWKTYKNEKYGFELNFPNTWKDLKVTDLVIGASFASGQEKIFEIFAISSEEWKYCQESTELGGCPFIFINKNDKFVFVQNYITNDPTSLPTQNEIDREVEVPSILSTFKFTK